MEENKKDFVNEPKDTDDRTFSEKVEDTLDDISDAVVGDKGLDGIPAVIKKDSGGYIHVKHRTNANIQKKIFGKKGLIVLGVIIVIGLVVCLIYYLLNMMLLS